MRLGMTDAFVTHSTDNNGLSVLLGPGKNWIENSKFLLLKDLGCQPDDGASGTTTSCVILKSSTVLPSSVA